MSPRRLDPSSVEVRLASMAGLLDDLESFQGSDREQDARSLALDGYRRSVNAVASFVAARGD